MHHPTKVVGVAFSIPEPPYTQDLLIAAVNEQADGRAAAIEQHLRQAFQIVSGRCDDWSEWKSSRFAVTVGDQALAPGGPANQTQQLGLRVLWDGMTRPPRDMADSFHLVNRAGKAALKQGPAIEAFFKFLKKLEQMFGLGHGRHVDRCVAAFLGQPHLACRSPAGHRKTGRLHCRIYSTLLDHQWLWSAYSDGPLPFMAGMTPRPPAVEESMFDFDRVPLRCARALPPEVREFVL